MQIQVTVLNDKGTVLESHTTTHLRPSNILFDTPHTDPESQLRLKGFTLQPIVEQATEPGALLEGVEAITV